MRKLRFECVTTDEIDCDTWEYLEDNFPFEKNFPSGEVVNVMEFAESLEGCIIFFLYDEDYFPFGMIYFNNFENNSCMIHFARLRSSSVPFSAVSVLVERILKRCHVRGIYITTHLLIVFP